MASSMDDHSNTLACHGEKMEPRIEENEYHLHRLATSLTLRTTKFMTFFSFWIALGGWIVNFDLTYTGVVLQMNAFNASFGKCATSLTTGLETCKLTATQQSVTSIYMLFMALGGALSSITGSYFGRRHTIMISNIFVIIGAAGMVGSAGNYAAYIACKCVGGVGLGQIVATVPMYGAECTPAKRRGLLVAVYSVGLSLGSVVVSLVCLGSHVLNTNWAWQTPIIIQIPMAIGYSIGLLLFPESPRWLMIKGREEQARNSFARFYSKDPHSAEIDAQIADIQETLNEERSNKASWTEIFRRKYIRRTLTSTAIICGSSLSGVQFVAPYATIFLGGLGIKNPFAITVYINLCIFAGNCVGPLPCQYLGRRVTLLTGYTLMASCMLIFAAVATAIGPSTTTAKNTLVAFLCLWSFCFGAFNSSTVWLASAEQHSVRHRTYGQAFATTISSIFNFACGFWTPYMISANYGNMGTNVGYFFFGLLIFYFLITFFSVPETGNITLEQIDQFYNSGGKAWKTSLKKNKSL